MNSTKNLKLIIAVLLIGLVISLFFNPLKQDTSIKEDPKEVTGDTTTICMDFNRDVPSTLRTGLVNDMVEQYRNKQLSFINASTDFVDEKDAHSIWFHLDTIKKFIYHIEKNARKNGVKNSEDLGLRFYYAAYPNIAEFSKSGNEDLKDLTLDPLTMKYATKHTLVIIPTIYNNAINGNVDFNPLDNNTYDGYVSMPKDIKDTNEGSKASYQTAGYMPMALTPTGRIGARNHGALIPPASTEVEGF